MARTRAGLPAADSPRVTIGFPLGDYERLQRIADERERSLSWVVRHAVRKFLDKDQDDGGRDGPDQDCARIG